VPGGFEDCPEGAKWDDSKWTCQAANDAGGIVIPVDAIDHVMFLPGFITTFDMEMPTRVDFVGAMIA
jgi:hypothetical protein